jgi:heat-inducible transcriptional repressor
MESLSERQKLLLSLVIHEHTRTAAPVGSNNLVKHYNLDMSSATVRNEMAALTDMGYLRQPHTSAGREPTEEGYRYFVGRLLQQTELPYNTQHMIAHQFYQTRRDVEQWMRLAASVLAHQSKAASLVTAPHSEMARLKHVELISTRGRQVLMVLVMMGGELVQQIISLAEPLSQDELSRMARRITSLIAGKNYEAIRAQQFHFQGVEWDVVNLIIQEMERLDSIAAGEVYLDGLTNVLTEPEFAESEEARRALRLLEERSLLQDLLTRAPLSENVVGGVQVLIGGEGTWDELRQCSIVLARYGTPGSVTGALGVLGPIRMSYARSISTVRFMANLLSDLVTQTMIE